MFKLNQEEFLRLVSDIAEKVILIRLLEWLLEFEVKKKDMLLLVFIPFGDRL